MVGRSRQDSCKGSNSLGNHANEEGESQNKEGPRTRSKNVRTRPVSWRERLFLGATLTVLTLAIIAPRFLFSDADAQVSGPGVSGGNPYFLPAVPTLGTWGTLPSIVGTSPASVSVNVGTGAAASTGVLNLPVATHGWACSVADVTTPATNLTQQTGSSTNSATFTNFVRTTGVAGPWNASDILQIDCWPN